MSNGECQMPNLKVMLFWHSAFVIWHLTPSGLYRGFIYQHDRYVVFDRIDAPALRALQRGAALDELDLRLAVGARQNLEQLRIDRHMTDYYSQRLQE